MILACKSCDIAAELLYVDPDHYSVRCRRCGVVTQANIALESEIAHLLREQFDGVPLFVNVKLTFDDGKDIADALFVLKPEV